MPELPEVEIMRQYFKTATKGKRIVDLELYDKKMFKGDLHQTLQTAKGKRFISTDRRGKYLFASTKTQSFVLHFGMTGDLELCSANMDRPRFSRFAFLLEKDEHLHVLSMRKFGYVKPIENINSFILSKKLGDDALGIRSKRMMEILDGRGKLKPFLMSQKHLAGVGNWIADELLFRINLHPETELSKLSLQQKKELHKALQKLLKQAISYKTNKGNFHPKWFVNHRVKDGSCPQCETTLSKKEIGGRSTYFCENCQEKF